MIKNKLIIISYLVFASFSWAKVTPSDVFVEAKALKIALASQVIKEKGVSLLPVLDIDLKGATPASVYSMGAVLNYKLQVYAKVHKKKWINAKLPNEKIVPGHVKDILLIVEENIKNIFGIESFKRDSASGKKPADVMVELTYANQWLDKLMPFVKPQYPYAILKETDQIINKIFQEKGITPFKTNARTHKNISPNDVFINVTSTYNLLRNVKLTRSKQSSPSHPYDILSAKDKIKPLDIFTITTFNLFFLYTSVMDCGLTAIDTIKPLVVVDNIKPNDVFRQADIINSKLANLIATGGK